MIDTRELAWAAGLFEGEGCFTINRGKRGWPQPYAKVSSTDLDVLERFQAAMGFGKIYGPYRNRDGVKPWWQWSAQTFEKTQATVAFLWFGLCERRRSRAAEVLDAANS